jgi:hypothetical protein
VLEAGAERPIALRTLALDPFPSRLLGTLPLESLALQSLRDRLSASAQRDHLGVATSQPQTGFAWRRTLA